MGVEAEAHETVAHLKSSIQRLEGVAPAAQRLLFDMNLLEDDNTIEANRLTDGCTLTLVLLRCETDGCSALATEKAAPYCSKSCVEASMGVPLCAHTPCFRRRNPMGKRFCSISCGQD